MSIISKNIENLKPNKEYIVTVRAKNNDINVLSEYTDSIRFRTPTDSTIPEAPTGLVLAASFLNVLFKYTDSVDEDTAKYEYELYKDDQIEVIGGLNSIISGENPHRTGFVQTNVFLVSVDDNSTTTSTSSVTNPVKYYGRVRSIDSAGNIGGWTNIVASGDTPLIDEEFIGSLTAAKITAGTIGAHEIILTQPGTATSPTTPDNKAVLRSSDYNGSYNNTTDAWTAGTAGWIISGDGRAEFNNIVARGELLAGAFSLNSNNYWNSSTIKTYGDYSDFRVGDSTRYILWDNSAGTLSITGTINAVGGTFSGSITASGTISGGTISGATVTGGTVQTAASGQRIVLSGTTFNLYAAGSGDTSTIAFYPAATTNYGLMTSTGGLKITAQGATMSIGFANTDLGSTGIKLEAGAYFQVLDGTIDAKRNVTTDWRTANIIARASTSGNCSIAFRGTADSDTGQIRSGGGANYFYFRNYNDTANVRIIASDLNLDTSANATDVNSANVIMNTSNANVSLGFKASNGTYSAQIRLGGSNALYFTEGLNSAVGVDTYAKSFTPFSDYRIKENFESIIDSCSLVKKLNPLKFTYVHKPEEQAIGFIAHEVQEIMPYAVVGVKDKISEDGQPVYQALHYNMITTLLSSAIKEIIERLEILENK